MVHAATPGPRSLSRYKETLRAVKNLRRREKTDLSVGPVTKYVSTYNQMGNEKVFIQGSRRLFSS